MQMTESEFRQRFQNSAVRRAKYAGFLRNVAVALGNTKDPAAVPVLSDALLQHAELLVRAHAAWALGEVGGENSWGAGKATRENKFFSA
jgi:epoxyqueuosine reductase